MKSFLTLLVRASYNIIQEQELRWQTRGGCQLEDIGMTGQRHSPFNAQHNPAIHDYTKLVSIAKLSNVTVTVSESC